MEQYIIVHNPLGASSILARGPFNKIQTEQRLALAGPKPEVICIGFLEPPTSIDAFLEGHDFIRRYDIPVRDTGILSTIYSPNTRNNPQFAFSEMPLSDWENITSSNIAAEGILTIAYPLPSEMKTKYDALLKHLNRRFRIIIH